MGGRRAVQRPEKRASTGITQPPSAVTLDTLQAWQREGLVEYLGEAHDVREHIANADCVVLPSYREGVPRTLMEASAMGRPIVATDVPGCREVVADGITGFLCEAKSAASLADKLQAMMAFTPDERRAMGERGRAKVAAEFDETTVIARYLETLRELTGVSLYL